MRLESCLYSFLLRIEIEEQKGHSFFHQRVVTSLFLTVKCHAQFISWSQLLKKLIYVKICIIVSQYIIIWHFNAQKSCIGRTIIKVHESEQEIE